MDYSKDFLKIFNESAVESFSSKIEHLKQVVNVLLHFKYMLVFIRKKFSVELDFKLKNNLPELQADLEFCSDHYNQLINSCIFFDLIRMKEELYKANSSYCSFKQQYLYNASIDDNQDDSESTSAFKINNKDLLPSSMIQAEQNPEISSEPSSNLTHSNDEFKHDANSSNTFNLVSSSALINSKTDRSFNTNQLVDQMQYNNESQAASIVNINHLEDSTNKSIYTNLVDAALTKQQNVASKSNKDMLENLQSASSCRQKKQPPRSSAYQSSQCSTNDCSPSNMGTSDIVPNKPMDSGICNEDNESLCVENDLLQVEYWCSFEGCRFKSKSLTQVKAHEERRHVKQIVKCAQDGCGSFFDTKDDLNSHMSDIHSGPLFQCALDECAKEFNSDYRLKQHIREEHKEEYLTCKLCTKKFKTRKYLTRHFRNVHPKDKFADEIANTISCIDSKISPMNCTIDNCDKKFIKRSKLKQHIKEEHKEEYLTCKFCDKVCKTRNNLTNHIWIMHEEGDFKCTFDDCSFASKFRKNLLNHKKLRHQRVRQCPINECGEMIPITRYQRHMSSLHKIKNYACSWPDCGKSFADHNALKNHVRIHLNFKRYKCKWPACGYASEQRFTVITHIRVCHFKLPRTKKKQLELNISPDLLQNPYDYLEVCREDICI